MDYSRPLPIATIEQHWNETLHQRRRTRCNTAVATALEKYQEAHLLLRTGEPIPSLLYRATQKRAFRFEGKWPMLPLAAAIACLLIGLLGYATITLKIGQLKTESGGEGPPFSTRLVTSLACAVFVGASAVIFQFIRRRLTLRTHIEALHLLYVFDKMPTSGPNREVFDMKVPLIRGKVVHNTHYRVFSDGTIREDHDSPVCC